MSVATDTDRVEKSFFLDNEKNLFLSGGVVYFLRSAEHCCIALSVQTDIFKDMDISIIGTTYKLVFMCIILGKCGLIFVSTHSQTATQAWAFIPQVGHSFIK